jgi:hypothetical protein
MCGDSNFWYSELLLEVDVTIPHTSPTATVVISSTLNEVATNGIKNYILNKILKNHMVSEMFMFMFKRPSNVPICIVNVTILEQWLNFVTNLVILWKPISHK